VADVHEYSDTHRTWTKYTNGSGPSNRKDFALATHAASSSVVLFGGNGFTANHSDVYEFGNFGASCNVAPCWRAIPTTSIDRLGQRSLAAAAYDQSSNQLVVFGGIQSQLGVEALTGLGVADVFFFPPMSVTAIAGGTGFAVGSALATPGYEMVVWNPLNGAFSRVDAAISSTTSTASPALTTATRNTTAWWSTICVRPSAIFCRRVSA